jgi:acyl carrier protein
MSLSREQILEITREVLTRHARGPVTVTEDTELIADLGVDSLGVMEALAEVEDRFEIAFDDEDLRAIGTFGELCDAVLNKRRTAPSSANEG